MQQSRRAGMDLRQLLVAARGGTVHPDIYHRKWHRYGLHTEALAYPHRHRISVRIVVRAL
jgi:hypothetical protein